MQNGRRIGPLTGFFGQHSANDGDEVRDIPTRHLYNHLPVSVLAKIDVAGGLRAAREGKGYPLPTHQQQTGRRLPPSPFLAEVPSRAQSECEAR